MFKNSVNVVDPDRVEVERDPWILYRKKRAEDCGAAYNHHYRVNINLAGNVGQQRNGTQTNRASNH
jgi:hypothetical protein